MKMFLSDTPAVEIWACLAMFKLKSPTLYFWPLYIAWSRMINPSENYAMDSTEPLKLCSKIWSQKQEKKLRLCAQ